MENKITRMKELIDILTEASRSYYVDSISIISDYEYDKLYDELVALEKETGMTLSNSPTINIEYEVSSSLEQVAHSSPMLSLAKTKKVSELIDFLGDKEGLLSWKLDGLTIVLTYKDGKLIKGVTRGTGLIGEVITDNVKRFKNVPLNIPYKGELVVRGEAIIKYSDFNRINAEITDESSKYKNPRNLCSGSVRQLDSNITAKRNVNCIIFALISMSDMKINSKEEQYDWLTKMGFEVAEHIKVTKDNLADIVLYYKNKIVDYDIPSDGLVLTFDDVSYGESLGTTAKYPKHSIAFKWQDETYETTLLEVDWNTSRTGLINPIAVFTPVEIDGTIVSRASLHNISILRDLELGIGDTIEVYKANMIIPQIADNDTRSNTLEIPNTCPICHKHSEIIKFNNAVYLSCTNDNCPAKLSKKLSLFVSRNAMNIDGISDAYLNKFIEEGYIKNYYDIYHINNYKEEIISLNGFGEKSYNNLIDSINKSRKVKLPNFIYSLGIPEIGLSRAKLICNKYNNDYNTIRNLSYEELSEIDGVGEVIAREWINAFSDEVFLYDVERLLNEIEFVYEKNNDNKLQDKTFVITGSLNNFENRDELVNLIENHGGKVVKSISNTVNYLINNDIESTSTKNKEAKELNIEIISENKFLDLLK